MIIERVMHSDWLTNTFLVYDEAGGKGVLIDAGGPLDGLFDVVEQERIEVPTILLTHHHFDHIAEIDRAIERLSPAEVLIHPAERELVPQATGTISPGDRIDVGGLTIEALHIPGHTAGMYGFLLNETELFTGDTLFKGSVGGVRAPGHTTYADLKRSIMDTIMKLPPTTTIHAGHSDPSTVGEEWEHNAFIRIWRGLDPEGSEQCTALGEPATLILNGPDYDGGHKAWVRWPDGSDDIVPGSQVQVG